jgi:DNA-binding NtrC family response regulator
VRRQAVEAVERQYLKELLSVHRGRIDRTAASAGVTGRQIHKLLQRHEIRKEDFK